LGVNEYTISGTISSTANVQTYNYTVTPTNTNGCTAASNALVQITVNAASTKPTYAKTDVTWSIAGYTWSDRIYDPILSDCTKQSNLGTSDVTKYYYTSGAYTYFQWACVVAEQAALCDNGWSVPTNAHFAEIKNQYHGQPGSSLAAVIGSDGSSKWGFGGSRVSNYSGDQNTWGLLWSITAYSGTVGYFLGYHIDSSINTDPSKYPSSEGLTLRCVK
jgi:hypothetical protein